MQNRALLMHQSDSIDFFKVPLVHVRAYGRINRSSEELEIKIHVYVLALMMSSHPNKRTSTNTL